MKTKRIHFEKRNKLTNVIFILLALILVCIGDFDFLPNLSSEWAKRLNAIGYFFIAIHFGKMFIHPNYVEWNKRGMSIKIKSILGRNISFKDVKSTNFRKHILKITKTDGKEIKFDLNEFEAQDIDKLNQILLENTVVKSVI